MGYQQTNETSPLLKREETGEKKPRLPAKQLLILAICRISDPICLTSIFSYLPQMIRSFGVAEADIGFWAGVISASLAISQSLTGVAWGRISDRIGRKPSIIFGLIAMITSILLFGFSGSISMAIFARCCVGLTGNVGILRTVVAELVPDPDLKLQALSILPIAWNLGTIIGPAIGGLLSEPVEKYPSFFSKGGIFEMYPWALPNLVIASVMLTGCILVTLFLDETLADRKNEYDPGRTLGKKIESLFGYTSSSFDNSRTTQLYKDSAATDEENPISQSVDTEHAGVSSKTPLPWSQVLTPQSTYLVILLVLSGIHRVTAEQLLSLVFATHVHSKSDPIRLPFHLPGGFGLNSSQIGLIFAVSGVAEILIQIFIYTPMVRKYGNRRLLAMAALSDPIIYFLIPYTLALYDPLSSRGGDGTDSGMLSCYTGWAFIMLMVSTNSVLGLNSCVILVTDSASSPRALATLNGFATSMVSLGIAIGPSTFGWLYSIGQKKEWTTIPWVGLALVSSMMWIWIPKLRDSRRETGDNDRPDAIDSVCGIEDEGDRNDAVVVQPYIVD